MDLCFNELSVFPLANNYHEAYVRIQLYLETFKEASANGFRKIRYDKPFDRVEILPQYTLNDFCHDFRNATFRTLLLSTYRYPYLDEESEEETKYIEKDYFIRKNGNRIQTIGLASAYLLSTIGIGFRPEKFWESFQYLLEIVHGNKLISEEVLCASIPTDFDDQVFSRWKDSLKKIDLVYCEIPAKEKEIHLRNDHGKDVLYLFSKRLVKSIFIVKVINSLPFNSQEKNFIRKIHPSGVIEIVLTWTDAGYGLVVQTTGRNKRETVAIAKILNELYGLNQKMN
ncbi:MAG: hypothetical protein JXA03_05835 [Bacteroidales bacterium]|nr:hypothetical protein [Bacteroidales bacterium]